MSNLISHEITLDLPNLPYFLLAFMFGLGTIIGSFLNVVIYRTPKKEQIIKGRSHCMGCGKDLEWNDLIPIFSWVFLRGKCRYCKARVSGRYAFVELLCGLSFAALFYVYGLSLPTLFGVILFPVLIGASFIDLDTGEIEYWCPIIITGLGIAALTLSLCGVAPFAAVPWYELVIGAFIVSVPLFVLALFGGMGVGDVTLMAAAGLLMGWNIVPAAFIGIFLGAFVGIYIKFFKKRSPETLEHHLDKIKSEADAERLAAVVAMVQISEDDPLPTEDERTAGPIVTTPETTDIPVPLPPKAADTDVTNATDAPEDNFPTMTGTVMKFGPCLAVGIAVAYLYGDKIIEWYLSLMSPHYH